jgi:hypothetical protein
VAIERLSNLILIHPCYSRSCSLRPGRTTIRTLTAHVNPITKPHSLRLGERPSASRCGLDTPGQDLGSLPA